MASETEGGAPCSSRPVQDPCAPARLRRTHHGFQSPACSLATACRPTCKLRPAQPEAKRASAAKLMRSTSRWTRPCTVTTRSRSCSTDGAQGLGPGTVARATPAHALSQRLTGPQGRQGPSPEPEAWSTGDRKPLPLGARRQGTPIQGHTPLAPRLQPPGYHASCWPHSALAPQREPCPPCIQLHNPSRVVGVVPSRVDPLPAPGPSTESRIATPCCG